MTTATVPVDRGPVSVSAPMMGGRVSVHLHVVGATASTREAAEHDAARTLARMGAWAARLTRFSGTSDLSRLNADARRAVPVRPTLGALLDWGRAAEAATDGVVDIALLDARLAAEQSDGAPARPRAASPASRSWSLARSARRTVVHRPAGLRFDLDGVGKGWLADRALDMLSGYPAALVDADGDIAISLEAGETWLVGIDDGRVPGGSDMPAPDLATLELVGAEGPVATRFGLATSGTSVHRWEHDGGWRHHLIDPATERPAVTDVVQATVLAASAREAEALAKAAVIRGSEAACQLLERPSVWGALLLTERGELLAMPGTERWLA